MCADKDDSRIIRQEYAATFASMTCDELRQIREEQLGYSQRVMAHLLGTKLRTYQNWEAKGVPGVAAVAVRQQLQINRLLAERSDQRIEKLYDEYLKKKGEKRK